MSPEDPRHGSEAGFEQHNRDDETPCDACHEADLIAARRRGKRKAMGHTYRRQLGTRLHADMRRHLDAGASYDDLAEWAGISPSQVWRAYQNGPTGHLYTRTWNALDQMQPRPVITPIGITRRIRALAWLGYSVQVIADEAGVDFTTISKARATVRKHMNHDTRNLIAAVYDRLAMTAATSEHRQTKAGITRARNMARRNQWEPPLSWDDIDSPDAEPYREPKTWHPKRHTWKRDDLLEEWAHLTGCGVAPEQAARQLGVTVDAVERAGFRARGGAA